MSDKTEKISRREFLKAAGLATGGVAIGSLALLAACQNETTPVAGSSTTTNTTASTIDAPTTSPTTTSTTTISTSSSTTTPTTTTSAILPTTSSAPTAPPTVYVPPVVYPPLLEETYGCASRVASDRWYTADHLWVKEWEGDKVVIGITDKMQELLSVITHFVFNHSVGDTVGQEYILASVEAQKLNTDILSPVSGKILQINTVLQVSMEEISRYPYTNGWLVVMQLTHPQEMEKLFGPNYYAYLQAVKIPSIVPPMRS